MTTVEYIDQFIDSLTKVNDRSLIEYRNALNAFFRYLVISGQSVTDLKPFSVRGFNKYMENKNMSSLTVRFRDRVLKSFAKWYAEQGYGVNFAIGLKLPKVYKGFKRMPLTDVQIERLSLSLNCNTMHGLRDYLIIHLMHIYGLRDCEVSRIDYADVRLIDQDTTLYIKGKGDNDKSESFVLEEVTVNLLQDYIINYRPDIQEIDPLFVTYSPNSRGNRMRPSEVGRVVKLRMNAVGLTGSSFTAHSLRHTTATSLILKGADIYTVQVYMRHSSTEITKLYTRYTETSLIKRNMPSKLLSNVMKNPYLIATSVNKHVVCSS